MATALKKIIQIARDIYEKMEADRWGTISFGLSVSKLYLLEDLLTNPISDQHLVTLIDLEIAKKPAAEVDVMKMNLQANSIETILKILKNCALANINQLSIEKTKAENDKLIIELQTRVGFFFGFTKNVEARTLQFYDPENAFINELDAIYADITAEKDKVMVAVTAEPDQTPMTPLEVERLKLDIKKLNDTIEALTYSYNKKVRTMSVVIEELKMSTQQVTELQAQLKDAEHTAQKKLTEISHLQSNLQQAERLREEQALTQAKLEKRIAELETALKNQADRPETKTPPNRYRFNPIISSTSNRLQVQEESAIYQTNHTGMKV